MESTQPDNTEPNSNIERQENGNSLATADPRFRKPEEMSFWQKCKLTLYNPKTKRVLGRNSNEWRRVAFFYLGFYFFLSIMIAICAAGLMYSLNFRIPKYLLGDSLIGTNPGLGFRPMSDDLKDGALISYSIRDQKSIERWSNLLDDFMKPYLEEKRPKNVVKCGFRKYPRIHQVCKPDTTLFGQCSKANSTHYGFDTGSPCIFIKLNRIINWEPIFHKSPQKNMPEVLNKTIMKASKRKRQMIWVTCEGENEHDRENVKHFEYNPAGFPGYFYPYTNNDNYLSPLVAVRIVKPKRNVLINIECRAWAENIEYQKSNDIQKGSVVFQLFIQDPLYQDGKQQVHTTTVNGKIPVFRSETDSSLETVTPKGPVQLIPYLGIEISQDSLKTTTTPPDRTSTQTPDDPKDYLVSPTSMTIVPPINAIQSKFVPSNKEKTESTEYSKIQAEEINTDKSDINQKHVTSDHMEEKEISATEASETNVLSNITDSNLEAGSYEGSTKSGEGIESDVTVTADDSIAITKSDKNFANDSKIPAENTTDTTGVTALQPDVY